MTGPAEPLAQAGQRLAKRPDYWTIRSVGVRLAHMGDPLAPLIGRPQLLPKL